MFGWRGKGQEERRGPGKVRISVPRYLTTLRRCGRGRPPEKEKGGNHDSQGRFISGAYLDSVTGRGPSNPCDLTPGLLDRLLGPCRGQRCFCNALLRYLYALSWIRPKRRGLGGRDLNLGQETYGHTGAFKLSWSV